MVDLITEKEAAQILGIKPQSLAVWRMNGENLSFIRIGRLIRYRREDLEHWIEGQTVRVGEG